MNEILNLTFMLFSKLGSEDPDIAVSEALMVVGLGLLMRAFQRFVKHLWCVHV